MSTEVLAAWAAVVAAVTGLGTLLVAVVAARYAKKQVDGARAQLDEARTLRKEQAQPYVVMYAEPAEHDPNVIDLVLKNFGTTAALDVRPDVQPALRQSRSGGSARDIMLPAVIPILAPGQEWRTFWDHGIARHDVNLPDRHEGLVRFRDSEGKEHQTPVLLVWSILMNKSWIESYGAHHAAQALRGLDKTLAKWLRQDKVLQVATYDGKKRDREQAARQAAQDAVVDRLNPSTEPTVIEEGPPANQ